MLETATELNDDLMGVKDLTSQIKLLMHKLFHVTVVVRQDMFSTECSREYKVFYTVQHCLDVTALCGLSCYLGRECSGA